MDPGAMRKRLASVPYFLLLGLVSRISDIGITSFLFIFVLDSRRFFSDFLIATLRLVYTLVIGILYSRYLDE